MGRQQHGSQQHIEQGGHFLCGDNLSDKLLEILIGLQLSLGEFLNGEFAFVIEEWAGV